MAFLQVNLLSQALMRTVSVNVILPVDKLPMPGISPREDKPYKTLYLLHGILGNQMDWVTTTRVQRFAEEHNLAVVMPAGENAFYVDEPKSHNLYGEFIGKELVELTRKMFPLSHRREDTFIGGLSMGGYGAMRNGLKYHDTFGCIISLSGALFIDEVPNRTNDTPAFFESRDYAEAVFGDLDRVLQSDKNPKFLVEQILNKKSEMPKIFMACGEEDFLLQANRDFVEFLKSKKVEVTFVTGPGSHEWDFWDTYIKKAIEWLPTEEKSFGINSGNVK
ncbi:MAG: esterase family protein [Acetatifactor sp.]|nr:esterase family protein [Acetatifactor sp.]